MLPPQLALVVWSFLLLLLLRYASPKDGASSSVLWVPVIWIVMAGSRSPAQWLGMGPTNNAKTFEERNPLDRSVYLILIGLALLVLGQRPFHWRWDVCP